MDHSITLQDEEPRDTSNLPYRQRVTLVARHDPATLSEHGAMMWTMALTQTQREQMQQEAQDALREGEEHGDWSIAEGLDADWRVAEKLMCTPSWTATLPANWRVSDAWYWMPQWQAREQESEQDRAAGVRGQAHESEEAFMNALDAHAQRHAHV